MSDLLAAWANLIFRTEVLLGAVGALSVIFLTPIIKHLVENRLSRRPIFLVRSPIIRRDLFLTVEPLNSAAKRKRAIGISCNGFIIPQIATPTVIKRKILWQVNLAKVREIDSLLKTGTVTIQLFHDVNQMSAPIPLQYEPDEANLSKQDSSEVSYVSVDTIEEFLLELRSNLRTNINFSAATVTKAYPLETPNLKWINEFDGHELQIVGLTDVDILGNACEILADPRYANVFTFRDCHRLTMQQLTLGHSKPGSCIGGVLRFINCTNIEIRDCDLFGCGTHGLDFQNAKHALIKNCTIRDCTYGILQLSNVEAIEFIGCRFIRNREFDLIPISGRAKDIIFRNCEFTSNDSIGNFVEFVGKPRDSRIVFVECKIEQNRFAELSNRMDLVSIDRPIPKSNHLSGNHFLRGGRKKNI